MNLKIAICDDEAFFINIMADLLLRSCFSQIDLLDKYTEPSELIKKINIYDLIFLDIDMPEMSGLEIAKYCSHFHVPIVFVTNKESLVFEAYNTTNTFGFIRKSHLNYDFIKVMQRFRDNNQRTKYLTVHSYENITEIRLSEIFYIEKQRNSVFIHTENKIYKELNTLTKLEACLTQNGFIRTHIGFIVNIDHIVTINRNQALLTNGEKVPISRNKYEYVCREFLRRNGSVNE